MTKRALLIGINYTNTSEQLFGCINDVKNVKKMLIDVFDYPEDNIVLITDETELKPTRQTIQSQLVALVNSGISGDTLYFHYSGHGASIRDFSRDESDGKDEILIPSDYRTAGFITDDWLFSNVISRVRKGVNLCGFLDCCHSGTGMDLRFNLRFAEQLLVNAPPTSYKSEDWQNKFMVSLENQRLPIQGNVWMFSGCRDDQTSADAFINQSSQGAFTACLIDTIHNNLEEVENKKVLKKVKLMDILKEVNCRLVLSRFQQRSQLSVGQIQDFQKVFEL
jgi:hypothetical protein